MYAGNQLERRKAKVIGESYKIIFSGTTSIRNGVRVIIDEKVKSILVEVIRKSDRIIAVKLVLKEKVLNVVSVYSSLVGCEERD